MKLVSYDIVAMLQEKACVKETISVLQGEKVVRHDELG